MHRKRVKFCYNISQSKSADVQRSDQSQEVCDLPLVDGSPEAHFCRRESAVHFGRGDGGHEELPRLGKSQIRIHTHMFPLVEVGKAVSRNRGRSCKMK